MSELLLPPIILMLLVFIISIFKLESVNNKWHEYWRSYHTDKFSQKIQEKDFAASSFHVEKAKYHDSKICKSCS